MSASSTPKAVMPGSTRHPETALERAHSWIAGQARNDSMHHTLRALALLLGYPDATLRTHLGEIVDAIDAEAALPASRRAEIRALLADLLRTDPIEVEARYVELFDRGRSTSLHLFEHVHGDSRDRGPAMIDLIKHYEAAGLRFDGKELPDHLCVVLEFASTQPPRQAREFLAEMAHILQAIFSALRKRESAYASLVAAVLELAGQKAEAVPVKDDEPLDEAWQEPVAFDGCSTAGQARPGAPQPIQIVRRTSSSPETGARV
jgi:nitrate reductase molybdenum cofactor assembly chaperone NarJ/NarW